MTPEQACENTHKSIVAVAKARLKLQILRTETSDQDAIYLASRQMREAEDVMRQMCEAEVQALTQVAEAKFDQLVLGDL